MLIQYIDMANLVLIRDLCARKKMTIRELAANIGRNECSIQSAIRRGTTNTNTLELIAKALDVPAGVFFDGYNDETEVQKLQGEIKHLERIIEEKERTIQILLSTQQSKKQTIVGTKSAQ